MYISATFQIFIQDFEILDLSVSKLHFCESFLNN